MCVEREHLCFRKSLWTVTEGPCFHSVLSKYVIFFQFKIKCFMKSQG